MSGVLLVTGGGRGIGAAIAQLAGRRGYKVGVNYARDAKSAAAVVADIERNGSRALAIRADVGNEPEVVEMFGRIDRELGPVTALVNNAGVIGTPTPVARITADAVNDVLRTNVTAMFLCAREAVKRMSPEGGGKGGAIVNIGSMASRFGGMNGAVAYGASKGAIDSFTIGLAREVAPLNIRVNAVRPGMTRTDILAPMGGAAGLEEFIKRASMLGRLGEPAEVASLVLWLLSPEASLITGSIYDAAGGR